MTASLSGVFSPQFFTDAGLLSVGGRLYTYFPGTTTQKVVYTDAAALVSHTYTADGLGGSYIGLNARGELPSSLFLTSGGYDLTLKTSAGATVWTRYAKGSDDVATTLGTNLADTTDVAKGDALIGVKLVATGAAARTQHEKNSDAVSVKDFGAPANGIGSDTAATLASIAALGYAYLPSGNYLLSAAALTGSPRIYGDGADRTVISYTGGANGITAAGLTGVHLEGFTIRRVGATDGGDPIKLTNCIRPVIRGVVSDSASLANTTGGFVTLYGCQRAQVIGCQFLGGSSLFATSDTFLTTGVWGADMIVAYCIGVACRQGFDITYQRRTKFLGCAVNGSTSTFGAGFICEYENEDTVYSNCSAQGNAKYGFYVEGNVGYGVKRTTFIGCTARGNLSDGLRLEANFDGIQVIGGNYTGNISSGCFSGSTGKNVYLDSFASFAGNAVGITSASPFQWRVGSISITGNTGNAWTITGSANTCKFNNIELRGNGADSVVGFTYLGGNEWDSGPFVTVIPTVYKSDRTTTVTFTTAAFSYRRSRGVVEYSFALVTPNIALDASTYIGLPIVGIWSNGVATADTLRGRGFAAMNASGTRNIDGAFANDKLRIALTAAGDNDLRGQGWYEVA